MSAECSVCRRPVESRQRGAARILALLSDVDECDLMGTVTEATATLPLTVMRLNEVRDICAEMLCMCEQSTALAEVA